MTFSPENMLSAATIDGEFERGSPLEPFLDSISADIEADIPEIHLESRKPLQTSHVSMSRDSGDEIRTIENLNSWVTHSRIRILAGIPVAETGSPSLDGAIRFSDEISVWTYLVHIEQDETLERLTLSLERKTPRENKPEEATLTRCESKDLC